MAPGFDDNPRLRRVRRYVERNYAQPINLKSAAQVAGFDPSYFSALFSRCVGVPFSRWLAEFRIYQATRLLKDGNRPIVEVALDVGFNDLTTFYRHFRRVTGTSPARFRRTHHPFS